MATGSSPVDALTSAVVRFAWTRDTGVDAGRMGPVWLEALSIERQRHPLGAMLAGEVTVIAHTTGGLPQGATLRFTARDALGGPVAVDWEELPALIAGQQATLNVRWILPESVSVRAISLSLESRTECRWTGVHCPVETVHPVLLVAAEGSLQLAHARVSVGDTDEDDDTELRLFVDGDNDGPVLSDLDLLVTVHAASGDEWSRERVTGPPVLVGAQVLAFEVWTALSPPFRQVEWELRASHAALHPGPMVPALVPGRRSGVD